MSCYRDYQMQIWLNSISGSDLRSVFWEADSLRVHVSTSSKTEKVSRYCHCGGILLCSGQRISARARDDGVCGWHWPPGWAAPLPILLGRAAPGPGYVCWLRKFQDHAFGAGRYGLYLLCFGGRCERDGRWVSVRYYSLRCDGRGRANVDVYHDAASQTEKPVRQGKPACGNLQGRARR